MFGCSGDGSFHHTPLVCEGHHGDVVVSRKRFPKRCRIPLRHISTLQPVQIEPWGGLSPLVVNHGEFLAQLYHDQEMVRVEVCVSIRFKVDNIREVPSVNQNVVDLRLRITARVSPGVTKAACMLEEGAAHVYVLGGGKVYQPETVCQRVSSPPR